MDSCLNDVLDAQWGVATTTQLTAAGVTGDAIAHRVSSGQWLRVFVGVISVTNGPLSRAMMLQAAILYGGNGALLSHATAAEEWNMRRPTGGPVHITVAYGRSAVSQPPSHRLDTVRPTSRLLHVVHPGVIVHRSRAIAHIGVAFELPRTSAADTVLDLAQDAPDARTAMCVAVEAMSSGRVQPATMRHRMEHRSPRRYRRALLATMALLESGVHSVLEHRYVVDVENAHGLPNGFRQVPHVVDGRTVFEDLDYSVVGVPLIVRLDGQQFHVAKQRRFRDRRRDNAAELEGRPRLSYGWDDVTRNPCEVFGEVREVLVRGGWEDVSTRCSRCEI